MFSLHKKPLIQFFDLKKIFRRCLLEECWSSVTGFAALFVPQKTPLMVLFFFKYIATEFSLTYFLDDDKKQMDTEPTRQRVIADDSVGQNWNFLVSEF